MPMIRIPTGSSYVQSGDEVLGRGDKEGNQFVLERGAIKISTLDKRDAAINASERFVLIDLSDTTSFKHTATGRIRLQSFTLYVETDDDATGTIRIGVVTEVDASSGSVEYPWVFSFQHDANGTDSTDRLEHQEPCHGMDLEVDLPADTLKHVVTNAKDADSANWKTGTNLDSPRGDETVAPGDGDLVLDLIRVAGNFRFVWTGYYEAEAAT